MSLIPSGSEIRSDNDSLWRLRVFFFTTLLDSECFHRQSIHSSTREAQYACVIVISLSLSCASATITPMRLRKSLSPRQKQKRSMGNTTSCCLDGSSEQAKPGSFEAASTSTMMRRTWHPPPPLRKEHKQDEKRASFPGKHARRSWHGPRLFGHHQKQQQQHPAPVEHLDEAIPDTAATTDETDVAGTHCQRADFATASGAEDTPFQHRRRRRRRGKKRLQHHRGLHPLDALGRWCKALEDFMFPSTPLLLTTTATVNTKQKPLRRGMVLLEGCETAARTLRSYCVCLSHAANFARGRRLASTGTGLSTRTMCRTRATHNSRRRRR